MRVLAVPHRRFGKLLLLQPLQLLQRHAALRKLVCFPLATFLHLLVLLRGLQHSAHIFGKAQVL